MRQRRSGCIISTSSVAGWLAMPPLTYYRASRCAREAICESLAGEMKSCKVYVVALIEPGIIETDALPSIGCRETMNDEEWVEFIAGGDAMFFGRLDEVR
jgi:NADP-dependent 3-hydroxy acid dehydrogenase YdfG